MKLITLIQPTLFLTDLAIICSPQDGILLRQDAVWLSIREDLDWPVQQVYVLQADVQLRQLTPAKPAQVITNEQWVALTIAAEQVLLWHN